MVARPWARAAADRRPFHGVGARKLRRSSHRRAAVCTALGIGGKADCRSAQHFTTGVRGCMIETGSLRSRGKMMNKSASLVACGVLCLAQAALAQDKVAVLVPAVLDPNAPIGDAVKRECGVETSVGSQVLARVSERYPAAEQISNPNQAGPDRVVLKITLVAVIGAGGGGWSGTKSISIRAEALQGSKVVATRTMTRQSGGGVFGGVSGTCPIMDRIAAALGRDVAAWLPAALMAARYEAPSSAATPAAQPAPGPGTPEPGVPATSQQKDEASKQ